jgi:deoxyribodipyrimidine photolyase
LLGKPEELIPLLVKKYNIEAVFTNKSYSRYGTHRDEKVRENIGIPFYQHHDYLLAEVDKIEVRKVFTPFYKKWQQQLLDTTEKDIKNIVSFRIEEAKEVSEYIKIPKHPYFTMEF